MPDAVEEDALLHDYEVRAGELYEYNRVLGVAKGEYVAWLRYTEDMAAVTAGTKTMSPRVMAGRLKELADNQYFQGV